MSQRKEISPSPWRRRWQRWGIGLCRLSLIALAMAALAFSQKTDEDDPADLRVIAMQHFPTGVMDETAEDGFYAVRDADSAPLGWITRSNPEARSILGYSGPSDVAIVLDATRKVKSVDFLSSADTAGHVEKVRRDVAFWQQWQGRGEAALGDYGQPILVSGASLTSDAMARGIAARFGADGMDHFFPDDWKLEQIKIWFPQADQRHETSRAGISTVYHGENLLGHVLHSSRMGVQERGFQGSSDVLVGIAADGRLAGVLLLGSRDNEPYRTDVADELLYADGFRDRGIEEIIGNAEPSEFLLVSGASTTARSVYGTVAEMLRRWQQPAVSDPIPWQWPAAALWIGTSIWLGSRGDKRSRMIAAVISVGAGILLGLLIGQDQWIGWARHGISWRNALPMLALSAVALMVPAFTGKNFYCSRLCPHGAAQTLIGMAAKKRKVLPASLHRVLQHLPWLTLLAIWGLALLGWQLAFAHAEPFEVWSTGLIAFLPAALFTIGLVAAYFLPQAYCHYGCPTGALLKFLTQAPGRWTKRDSIASAFVAVAWFVRFVV
jgi:hypothetical protein